MSGLPAVRSGRALPGPCPVWFCPVCSTFSTAAGVGIGRLVMLRMTIRAGSSTQRHMQYATRQTTTGTARKDARTRKVCGPNAFGKTFCAHQIGSISSMCTR